MAESALRELIRAHDIEAHVAALVKTGIIPKGRRKYAIKCGLRLCERLETAKAICSQQASWRAARLSLTKIAKRADRLQALVDESGKFFSDGIFGDGIFSKTKHYAAEIAKQARWYSRHLDPRKLSRKALCDWVLIWDLADLFHAVGKHPGTAFDSAKDNKAIPSKFTRFVEAWLRVLDPNAKLPSRATYQRVLKEWKRARGYVQQRPPRGRKVSIRKAA